MNDWWLKPLSIVIGLSIIVILLLEAMPQAFPDVEWSSINPVIIAVTPWIVAFGVGVTILLVVTGRR